MGAFVLMLAIPLGAVAIALLIVGFLRYLQRRAHRADIERRLRAHWPHVGV